MKKKVKTAAKSPAPVSATADMVSGPKIQVKKSSSPGSISHANGTNGKLKEKIASNGSNHDNLDAREL
ncbi:MAG TPA: hypothetical protein VGG71_03980, partial [Chitinophagaceae bacterium]